MINEEGRRDVWKEKTRMKPDLFVGDYPRNPSHDFREAAREARSSSRLLGYLMILIALAGLFAAGIVVLALVAG